MMNAAVLSVAMVFSRGEFSAPSGSYAGFDTCNSLSLEGWEDDG